MKLKASPFEKINKTDKLSARIIKKERKNERKGEGPNQ